MAYKSVLRHSQKCVVDCVGPEADILRLLAIFAFHSHLVHIRWFIGVFGLLYRPLSIFKSCELMRYLAIAVMRWFPFIFKTHGSTHKDLFTNEYVRSLLELSISCLHRCVNIHRGKAGSKVFLCHIQSNHLKWVYVDFVMVILLNFYLCLWILNDKYIIIDNK